MRLQIFLRAVMIVRVSLSNSQYKVLIQNTHKTSKTAGLNHGSGGNIEGKQLNGDSASSTETTKKQRPIQRDGDPQMSMGHASPARLSINGTVAQIKWFVVGEKGQTYMELIEKGADT